MSQILALSRRLQEAEATIRQLQVGQHSSHNHSPPQLSISPARSAITCEAHGLSSNDASLPSGVPMINAPAPQDRPLSGQTDWSLPDLLPNSAAHDNYAQDLGHPLCFGSPIQPSGALMTEGQTSDLSVDANGQVRGHREADTETFSSATTVPPQTCMSHLKSLHPRLGTSSRRPRSTSEISSPSTPKSPGPGKSLLWGTRHCVAIYRVRP